MTRYTVVWLQDAQAELAELWLESANRSATTRAADKIDLELSEDALQKGEEVSEGLRSLRTDPLKVLFSVREEDRVVEVAFVKWTR